MALKALDIFKLLPKTNCKKCGCPTCLAFAMKLAQKQATLDQCPDVSEASRAALDGAAAPPIRLVAIGAGPDKLEIGNETVLFRHDEAFYHAPGIGVLLPDTLDERALAEACAAIAGLRFTRVGMELKANVVAIENRSGAAEPFERTAAVVKQLGLPMVLMTAEAAHAERAVAVCAEARPLIHAATDANGEAMARVARDRKCPLAVAAPDLERAAALAAMARGAGVEDIVLDLTAAHTLDTLEALTASRRLALKKKMRDLGYPAMVVVRAEDPLVNVADCCAFVAKYAGLVITSLREPACLLPVLTVSQNLYTDPRKPIQVEAKLCPVGAVTPESPLLITTNFSLTFYTVEGEVEASRVPAYIGVIDTEGTSVLTAFASDKLTAEKVAAFLKSEDVTRQIKHRKVIIPGYLSAMSGALQEESGWEVMVGPREASGISRYLKTVWSGA
ncbi:MAG: acetyl-CoA decarbonylase/synthase complex subunit gamma [Lentisphaerae bacterium RIFOXYC12_FULL_60_16]|nr:MAG: acetyl-CoA decarbonylase/synthase complex subunit gamma [Lentisphaerae bacterium RIFOXYC12_FULL_60_16]OGV74576.1 MAG: acetyl-CoA decarbonylase/synthase complex subunit gamma [Lentisphaerae bacterium RIFOXYA12_FULL_60_10]